MLIFALKRFFFSIEWRGPTGEESQPAGQDDGAAPSGVAQHSNCMSDSCGVFGFWCLLFVHKHAVRATARDNEMYC